MLEISGVHEIVETGDRLRVDIKQGTVENRTSGKSIEGRPPSGFLLDMLEAGGLIPFMKASPEYFSRAVTRELTS